MEYQDVITFNQDFYRKIDDKEITKFFNDKNYMIMLKALRKGPMTIEEIIDFYKEEGNEKALKTIYRYINVLEDVGLIAEAGKRVITDQKNKNKTMTIYTRTAKIFVDFTMKNDCNSEEAMFHAKILGLALRPLVGEKQPNLQKLCNFFNDIFYSGQEYFNNVYKNLGSEFNLIITEYDFIHLNVFLHDISWLAMLLSHDSLKKELIDCFD